MAKDSSSESGSTTDSINQNMDYSKYGKLEDPSSKGKKSKMTEIEDDYADSVKNEFKDLRHEIDKKFIADVKKQDRKMKTWAIETNKLISPNGKHVFTAINKEANDSLIQLHQDMTEKFGDCVMELADGHFRIRKTKMDISNPIMEFADVAQGKINNKELILETAEDDRVIGIPYTIANIGADKYYVINGRVYSGFAMWFGLNAIRSPEDYARNVDLAYNLPFVWAGFQLKSVLSLGSSFDITHGTEEEITPEEAFVNEVFKSRLRINVNKLMKTSFHLDLYGNAFWHIRRSTDGIPDKITILQPERMKVFLDPKTTRVLYYIYLPPVLAGMALTPYPNVRENPNIMWGPALTYPTPIVIDPQDIIHFKENDFTEYPFGLSACKAMNDPAAARMDINVIAPMIYKRYAKPLIHWKLDPMVPFQLTKGQIEGYIAGFKNTLQSLEPMSDPITSTRWSATLIGAAQGKAELLTILQDLDNQIFACIGVPESYFKPQMGTDRMLSEQDKTMLAAMQLRQTMVGENIQEKLVKPIVDGFDKNINSQLPKGEELPLRQWNQYPTIQWRETFKQDQVSTIQNTLSLLQAGLVDHSRAARRVGEAPPQESEELSRMQDLQKITQLVQIEQAKVTYVQAQLAQIDTQQVIDMGGTMAVQTAQAEAAAEAEGGSGGGEKKEKSGSPTNKKGEPKVEDNQKFRVTFTNKQGKKQTEVMLGSTLQKARESGSTIQKVEAAGGPAKQKVR